jgi:uncharacterized damage-inducible protein DinB
LGDDRTHLFEPLARKIIRSRTAATNIIMIAMENPYSKFVEARNPREVIQETPGRLNALAERLGPAGLERATGHGKWSVRQILCHLADGEIAFSFRLRQTLAEPHHVIQPYDQDAWGAHYGSASFDAQSALEAFSAARRWNVALLDSISADDFRKAVTHPERGAMTLQTIVETMAGHDLNHLEQIEEIAATA